MTKEQLIERIQQDLIMAEDGYYYFWPKGSGFISEYELRVIADVLHDKNKAWDEQVDAELSKEPT